MNNIPRQMLRRIVAKYGKEICSDARRCENLLKDLCGPYGREINVLVNAIEERVPLDLLAANGSMPLELLLTRIEKRLEEQTALTAEAARWSVDSWALALNLANEGEIQARQKKFESTALPVSKTETVQPEDSKSPNISRPNPVQTPRMPPAVPQSKNVPPIMRQPPQMPAPPVVFPTNNQPFNPPPAQPHTANQTVTTRKGFGIFRGCLLVIFLLAVGSIVLFLGVPYALEVMRETQRERQSEPPRFPVR